ncbi:hypothetical protein Droror1_Dr00002383 [Drosera rotundifolia]
MRNGAAVVGESNGADVNVVESDNIYGRTSVDASRPVTQANGSLMEAAKALQYIHWTVGNNVVNVVEDAVKTEAEVEVVTTEEFLVTAEAEVVTKKLEMTEKKKEEGNALFKAGEYAKASKKYEKSAEYIETVSDEEKNQSKALKISCNLNNASCKLKLKDYKQAEKLCTKVLELDSRNVKAFYRRAQAYIHLVDLELAEIDIRKALGIEPDNREVKLEYKALKDKVKEYNKKDAKFYSNMFSKLTKLESNDSSAEKTEVKEDAEAKETTAIAELSSEEAEEQLEQLEAGKAEDEEVTEEKGTADAMEDGTYSDKLEDESIKGNEEAVLVKDQDNATVVVVTAEYEHSQPTGVQKNDTAEEDSSSDVTDDFGIKASIDPEILKAVEEVSLSESQPQRSTRSRHHVFCDEFVSNDYEVLNPSRRPKTSCDANFDDYCAMEEKLSDLPMFSKKRGGKIESQPGNECVEDYTGRSMESEQACSANSSPVVAPEPDFHEFDDDRRRECFSDDQLWAMYDTIDAMPAVSKEETISSGKDASEEEKPDVLPEVTEEVICVNSHHSSIASDNVSNHVTLSNVLENPSQPKDLVSTQDGAENVNSSDDKVVGAESVSSFDTSYVTHGGTNVLGDVTSISSSYADLDSTPRTVENLGKEVVGDDVGIIQNATFEGSCVKELSHDVSGVPNKSLQADIDDDGVAPEIDVAEKERASLAKSDKLEEQLLRLKYEADLGREADLKRVVNSNGELKLSCMRKRLMLW